MNRKVYHRLELKILAMRPIDIVRTSSGGETNFSTFDVCTFDQDWSTN